MQIRAYPNRDYSCHAGLQRTEAITLTIPPANLMDGQISALRHWAKGRTRGAATNSTNTPRPSRRMAEAN
jgi:hypothetical protein